MQQKFGSLIPYKRKQEKETIGPFNLTIECLESLDKTIDKLFEELQRRGEQNLLDEYCPYFGVIWPAARALADYLASLGVDRLHGKRLLEVGCGLALPSLVAAKLGAKVIATDYHQEVPNFLARNLVLNDITSLKYQEMNWRSHNKLASGPYDYIVGSDLLYDKELPDQLAAFLKSAALPQTQIVITDPGRFYLQKFLDRMDQLGFVLNNASRFGEYDIHGEKNYLLLYHQP